MKVPLLHVPLTYDAAPELARLRMLLSRCGEFAEGMAHFYWLRLWRCWAEGQTEWRPLAQSYRGEHDWTREPLTIVIEDGCRWKGNPGELVKLLLEAQLLQVVLRGELAGLSVAGFWSHNEHVDPAFKSIQAKGGMATKKVRDAKLVQDQATQQAQLIQAVIPEVSLAGKGASEEEQKAAIAIVMRIYRACGQPVPGTKQYSEGGILERALKIHREMPFKAVDVVETHYLRNRDDASLLRDPLRVIETFAEIYARIQ